MSKKIEVQGHPGPHVREAVIPRDLTVKDAAKLLGLGRPALSNFLNGKAALSPEMAARLEKAFGANGQELLDMQARYDAQRQLAQVQPAVVKGYAPSVITIKAAQIEGWCEGNIASRSELPALLRKLVNSTAQGLGLVDFPAYDNAERKGWDGITDAATPTPWIPAGKAGWEFGCNKNPKAKADDDYAARVSSVLKAERAEQVFVFVTPRHWPGKNAWVKEKKALGEWKDVRAYDASDLEQWLEHSAPAQIWLAERLGIPVSGYRSLGQCWFDWANATDPILSEELFAPAIKSYGDSLKSWLANAPERPFVIAADSRGEAIAFLACCMKDAPKGQHGVDDQVIVFDNPDALTKLDSASPRSFIAVARSAEVEKQLAGFYARVHCIIVRPRNLVDSEPDITLDLLRHEDFRKALTPMGFSEHDADRLAVESGRSPTILRRRLSPLDAIKNPAWAQNAGVARALIPAALAGAWHADTKADKEIMTLLARSSYADLEASITALRRSEDSPLWSIGKYRGVASKIDAVFAVSGFISSSDLDDFFLAAEYVLSEADPSLELPEDKRPFAGLYGKVRDHSATLRAGICETLVLLAVHGNDLFFERLGIDIEVRVALLVRKLLGPLTLDKFLSHDRDLPNYAEAAPDEFLRLIETDLRSNAPVVFGLLKSADSSIFGGGCPRSGLLWALEGLAWNPRYLPRATDILARLSSQKIEDNWANKPEASLQAIYRSWMPQTAASLEERIKALESLAARHREVGWELCVEQFETGSRIGHYSHRPKWRGDASGAGQVVTRKENYEFVRKAVDIALTWPTHDERTLGDLIERLQMITDEDQSTVWDLVDRWADSGPPEDKKAALRERIRRYAFTRQSRHRNISKENAKRARKATERLQPKDPVVRYRWLFASEWVEESFDELENQDFSYQAREKRTRLQRTQALREIWDERGFEGIKELLSRGNAGRSVGALMAGLIRGSAKSISFVRSCLAAAQGDVKPRLEDCLRGYLFTIDAAILPKVITAIAGSCTEDDLLLLFLCMPFSSATWREIDAQAPQLRDWYWQNVQAHWGNHAPEDVTELLDRLLEAKRPVAAFHAVHLDWDKVETARLRRLLNAVATTAGETPQPFKLSQYDISAAFKDLQKRQGVTTQEKAQLEFMFLEALHDGEHGIPNLEEEIGRSPALYMQAIATTFRRNDGGEDPAEWRIDDKERLERVATGTYRLLDRIRRIPGTGTDGQIQVNNLKEWLSKVRDLCKEHGRAEIGDQMIGQLLANAPADEDGTWPCRPVREAMEWMSSEHVGRGFHVATRNARGVHWRGEGGDQERELSAKYRGRARKVAYEFPYVSSILESIAESYDREANWEDTDAKVRGRLG
ncbi:MAG: HigA family addiction module antitoxin [Hyphomicrobiaceae bacterium]